MTADEFDHYDGLGLAELVRRGDVNVDELLDIAIARVEADNPELNAVVSRLYDQARAAVAAVLPEGPFTGVPYLLKDLGAIGFTSLFNSAGNPAMSMPLSWSRTGLPMGVQFAAPFGDEASLIRLGAHLEAAEPWAARRPPAARSRRQP